ncbi:hypothetical protein ANN_00702 [Periplaneta americana]|uniref:Uncharacterized protein n=1 Tax=Periplaneta americana TaxID=6978 RepID=A0ABQ8TRI3_PERAM|nr:hypothetical protein ANN_00702 [Periplaneta americana]
MVKCMMKEAEQLSSVPLSNDRVARHIQNMITYVKKERSKTVGSDYLLNDAVSTTRLLRVDGIDDNEMVFGEMRLRIHHRLPDIRLMAGGNLVKNSIRRLRWAGHVAHMDESRNAYRMLVGRPEGKKSLERPKCRWEDNIKMDLTEMGYYARD